VRAGGAGSGQNAEIGAGLDRLIAAWPGMSARRRAAVLKAAGLDDSPARARG